MRFLINKISNAMLFLQDLFTSHWGSRNFNYTAILNEFRETLNNCDYYANCYYNAVSKNHVEHTVNFYKNEMTKHQNKADDMLKKYAFLEVELYRYYH